MLRTKQLTLKYKTLFAPKLDEENISILGYRVENEELDEHLAILKDKKLLKEKQERFIKNKRRFVGIGLDTLKTHLIVIGTTGSGKTEFIRSLSNDIWKAGGGEIFNDGKSDEKMLIEIATQLKEIGRDTSLRVINYLKPDKMSETNTLSPIAMMTPQRAVEFLMSLNKTGENADATHQYAVQQWTNLFNVFTTFRHIFGQTKSEINPKELLLDNQILYNLIPVSELGEDMTNIIGKISLALIDEVASIALMGEKISLHLTLKRIMKDKNTPKPLYLTFLDEYNSYPIPGVDIKLLQYRSLNIPVLIGIQNLAGLKVGGTNETSKENALANATKYFLKSEDRQVIEWLNSMLKEEEIMEGDYIRNWDDSLIKSDTGLKIVKKRLFDAQDLANFANGFGVIFKGSRAEDLVFMQTFYRGGKQSTIQLTHFIPFEQA